MKITLIAITLFTFLTLLAGCSGNGGQDRDPEVIHTIMHTGSTQLNHTGGVNPEHSDTSDEKETEITLEKSGSLNTMTGTIDNSLERIDVSFDQ